MDTCKTMGQVAALFHDANLFQEQGKAALGLDRINLGRRLMVAYGVAAMVRGEPSPLAVNIIKGAARRALGVRLQPKPKRKPRP